MPGAPARYLEVADTLRRPILDGTLPPGSRLPSRAQLAVRHRVSEQVSRHALRLLVAEGLAESRPGSGYYVRLRSGLHPVPRTDRTVGPVGALPPEDVRVRTCAAEIPEARRLGIRPGEPVYMTRCTGRGVDAPLLLHTSWEPTALTRGTGHTPADRPGAGNPVERLAAAGIQIDQVVETVSVRPARGPEAELLHVAPGHPVLAIERTHYGDRGAVETSDLVASTDRCQLVYRMRLPAGGTLG